MDWAHFKVCFHQQVDLIQNCSSLYSSGLLATSYLEVSLKQEINNLYGIWTERSI